MIRFENPVKLDDCCLYYAARCAEVSELPDVQNAYKLFTVIRGTVVINTYNNKYNVSSGDSFIALPYEIFGISNGADSAVEFNCVYFTADSGKFNEMLCGTKLGENERIIRDRNIGESLRCVVNELYEQKSFSKELVSLMCSQMLLYIMRCFENQNVTDSGAEDSGMKLCASIINYIDNRIFIIKKLSEVGDALGYNYSYLSNLFRKTLGITLNKYFLSKKMHEAEKLLVDTKMSVSKIAEKLNYSSVYAFSKAFKEFYGESPVNFRKKYK